ncbi:CHAT domain-containing protein [Actinocrispum sp. NPDC049592]|uniref:CHAT domain-containing protein n=1 Tax=Actinocrispum sp. NPDC049592 TaxID=3154835 RepID=UPI0034383EFB
MATLAALTADADGPASGMAGLTAVHRLIEQIPDARLRAELSGGVDHNRGILLMSAGRTEDATTLLDAALDAKQHVIAAVADPEPALIETMVKTLRARGTAYTRLGMVGRARDDLTRALDLATEHRLLAHAAGASHSLGDLELRTGDVPAALRRNQTSYRALREEGLDPPGDLELSQAMALLAAGLADEAGTHLDNVLPAMRAASSASELTWAEEYRAAAALLTGNYDLARTMAAASRKRIQRWGCPTCLANATLTGLRADTALALRDHDIPRSLPSRALRFAESLPVPRLAEQAAIARMLAARLRVRQGKLVAAQEILAKVPRPGRLTPIDYRMLRRLCRAELAVAEGDAGRALREIRGGLSELDQVRDRMGGLELLSGTALHGRELADLAVRTVLGSANPRRLFEWLERTRAQTYRYQPLAGVDNPELAERIAEVRSLTESIHQARHDGHPTAALRSRRADRLREANRLGWYSGGWGKPRPVVGLGEVGEQLGDRALVSFASSEDSLVAVVVVDGNVRMVELGSAAEAAERARMLNVDLNALAPDHLPSGLVEVISASARKQADLVDTQLVQPLQALIGDRDLVIVPTGGLYAVPWGVLPSLQARPTVVAPSATAWFAAERTPNRRGRTVLVRGPGLPAAVGEIDKLAMHHSTATLLDGRRATVAATLKALDGAKLAHIAAHGAHEPENALFSTLELADGALYAHELARLDRPPQHVVLAACELALNRIRPGDEALGFASALLASGSRTVIAPLSRVGDQASAAAMDDYHRSLAAGAKPAVALADAIAIDPLRRPFVCLGSGHS